MDLRCRLDEVLQVRASEEVTQIDKLAVSLVFDVDRAPSVLPAADGLAVDIYVTLGTHHGKGDDGLEDTSERYAHAVICAKPTLI